MRDIYNKGEIYDEKIFSLVLTQIIILTASTTVFAIANNDKSKLSFADVKTEYLELTEFYREALEVFPEAPIGLVPTYNEFIKNKNSREKHVKTLEEVYKSEIVVDGNWHQLIVFDDGSFEMISLVGDSIFSGLPDLVEGTPPQMRWRYICLVAYHQVNVNLNVYYNYSTEQYYFGTPVVFGDVPIDINVAPVSLYRSGSSNNYMTFLGNPLEYIPASNEWEYHFGLRLSTDLNTDTGAISQPSKNYEPVY